MNSLEEKINNILSEKNAEIAKLIASCIEEHKSTLVKTVDEKPVKIEEKPKSTKTPKKVTLPDTKAPLVKTEEVTKPVSEIFSKSQLSGGQSEKKTKVADTVVPAKVEEPKVVTKVTKKTTKETKVVETKIPEPKKEIKVSDQKCQHTIKSKNAPRLCEKPCSGEVNGIYYCATHLKSANENNVKVSSKKEESVVPAKKVVTTAPIPKCQNIKDDFKLTKSKDGKLFFKLETGDKIIFKLENKTPVAIGMILSGKTDVIKMNAHIKHTLESNNITFDPAEIEKTESSEGEEIDIEAEDEAEGEEENEIQIDGEAEAEDDAEEEDEDGENDVDDDDGEEEIEEEEASEEEEAEDE